MTNNPPRHRTPGQGPRRRRRTLFQKRLLRLLGRAPCVAPYQARDLYLWDRGPDPSDLSETSTTSTDDNNWKDNRAAEAPDPSDLPETATKKTRDNNWKKNRAAEAKAQIKILIGEGLVGSVEVKYATPPRISKPIFSTTNPSIATDDAGIAQLLSERERDVKTNSGNIYFLTKPPCWGGEQGESPKDFFAYVCQYTDLKTLVHYTEIYLHLLRTEPEVAKTFRFSPSPLPSHPAIRDVLDPSKFDRLSKDAPEMKCVVSVKRSGVPIRVLSLMWPIEAEAVGGIRRQFEVVGHDLDIY